MSDTNASAPQSDPQPAPKHPHASPGDVDKQILLDLDTAKAVSSAGSDTAYNAALVARNPATPASLTSLAALIQQIEDPATAGGSLLANFINTKKARPVATAAEKKLHIPLMDALEVIKKGAGATHRDDPAKRAQYFINKENFGKDRKVLGADATAIIQLARGETLKNVLPADIDTAAAALAAWELGYKNQQDADEAHAAAETALNTATASMNGLRRDIQATAEIVHNYHDPASKAARMAFHLPLTRPLNP